MVVKQTFFGVLKDQRQSHLLTLTNKNGVTLKLIDFGARIVELWVPDKSGALENVVLGYQSLREYESDSAFFGATIGRVANRIAKGRFDLGGKSYLLSKNNGDNTLHGGAVGFDKCLWSAEVVEDDRVKFTLISQDGDQGFPARLYASVEYRLTESNCIEINYRAESESATPVNMTNHSYFNLAGAGRGNILDHLLMIDSEGYTEVNEELLPTGKTCAVDRTPFDFRAAKKIGKDIDRVKGGFDHNFVIRPGAAPIARLCEPNSGRVLEIRSTQPGLQFYSGNFLDGSIQGFGGKYHKHGALCLETQHTPDFVNHPTFAQSICSRGMPYFQQTEFRFFVDSHF